MAYSPPSRQLSPGARGLQHGCRMLLLVHHGGWEKREAEIVNGVSGDVGAMCGTATISELPTIEEG
jgi:hypothetical protein